MRRLTLAGVVAAAAAAALAVLPASAASAHDYLVGSTPANGATVDQPLGSVSLEFNDVVQYLNGRGAIVQVTDASGRHFETGCATVTDRSVSAPVALGNAGTYTIDWRIVSADGHPVASGDGAEWQPVVFQYQPPAGTPSADGSAKSPCAEAAEAEPDRGAETGTSAPDSSTIALIAGAALAGALVVAALVVGVTAAVRRSRRG